MRPSRINILDVVTPTLTPEAKVSALGKSIDMSIKETWIRVRDKRFAALRRVERHVRCVPLPPLTIWVPSVADATSVRIIEKRIVVLLSPELERHPQSYVNGVVAHEIAHVYLGHVTRRRYFGGVLAERAEPQADALAKAWGFRCAHE